MFMFMFMFMFPHTVPFAIDCKKTVVVCF